MNRDCDRPLLDTVLLEWWAGELTVSDRRMVDRHLLGCAACSSRAEVLNALAEGVRDLAGSGRIQAVVTAEFVERLRLQGRTVREYRAAVGGTVQCTLARDDEFLIARLQARIGPATRVDVLLSIDDGPEFRVADLPCNSETGEVILAFPVDEIAARPAHLERVRLMRVEPEGERLIGEYTFNHTPWPGRPGADPS
jgi:hypothetical protein